MFIYHSVGCRCDHIGCEKSCNVEMDGDRIVLEHPVGWTFWGGLAACPDHNVKDIMWSRSR